MARMGIDIIKISRIEEITTNPRFMTKVFTEREIDYLKDRPVESVAGSFSAKEAVSKVFGTGIGRLGFKDIEILRDDRGKPYVVLSAKGRALARDLGIAGLSISISHEEDYGVAVAMEDGSWALLYEKPEGLFRLKDRDDSVHKGDLGKLAVLGGSEGMAGSVVLSSRAALRTGSGLVYTYVPDSISHIVQYKSLENIVRPFSYTDQGRENLLSSLRAMDALAFGPGLGRSEGVVSLLAQVLELGKPMIVDADGINAGAKLRGSLGGKEVIISPHRGEMANFTAKSLAEVNAKPLDLARETAKKYGIIIILKGHETIVTNGDRVFINKTGNSGMATAGGGDVLTGMVGSFLGQGYSPYEAACLGVHIHGLAGDMGATKFGKDSLIAGDIIDMLPHAIREFRKWK